MFPDDQTLDPNPTQGEIPPTIVTTLQKNQRKVVEFSRPDSQANG